MDGFLQIKVKVKEGTEHSINVSRSLLCKVGVVVVALLLVGGYQLRIAIQNHYELAQYRNQYAVYTEKLQKISDDNIRMQKELSQLATLEKKVRDLLVKAEEKLKKEEIDKESQRLDHSGKGAGQNVDKLEIIEATQKLIDLRIAYKRENLTNMASVLEGSRFDPMDGKWFWPTESGYISSNFGYRADPFGGGYGHGHDGLDIASDYGVPIYAALSGTVEQADWEGGYGLFIRLGHGEGLETCYGHLEQIKCKEGEYVRKGQLIGYMGSTGASTGPHLHFEVRQKGTPVNPLRFLMAENVEVRE